MRPLIPPPVIAFIVGILMWLVDRRVPALQVEGVAADAGGLLLVAAGLGVEAVSVAAFFRAKTTINPLAPDRSKALVTDGLYRFSRNPMYVGMAMLLAGWALWLGQPMNLAFVAAFVALITELQIKPEERALEAAFGEDYRAYKARVRRWL